MTHHNVYLHTWLRGPLVLQHGMLALLFVELKDNKIVDQGFISFKPYKQQLKKQMWYRPYQDKWQILPKMLSKLEQDSNTAEIGIRKLETKMEEWKKNNTNFCLNHRSFHVLNGYYEFFMERTLFTSEMKVVHWDCMAETPNNDVKDSNTDMTNFLRLKIDH